MIFLRYILFLFLLVFTSNATSQTYFSFVDTNSIWSEVYRFYGAQNTGTIKRNYEKYFKGDTIINNKKYKKFYYKEIEEKYKDGQTTLSYYCNDLMAFVREDSLKRVYYCDKSLTEILIYDFGLQVGDSILITDIYGLNSSIQYNHVTSIDSVYIFDRYRKRTYFEYGGSQIEGIGKSCGVRSYYLTNNPAFYALRDYYYKNEKSYHFPASEIKPWSYYWFDDTSSLIDCSEFPIESNLSHIYPIPAVNQLIIKNNVSAISEIIFFDLQGNLVKSMNSDDMLISLDVSKLARGIYFVKIRLKNDFVETREVMLE